MKASDYKTLEKEYEFKKSYLNSTSWWRSILLVPPCCFLFVGLIGILYLFNHDMLVSFYLIPYIVLFLLGTIWLKTVRKYLQKAAMTAPGAFQICMAKPIGERNGYIYTVFANDNKRHDKHYIANLIESMPVESIIEENEILAKKKTIFLRDSDLSDTGLYLRAYFNNDITKRNPSWKADGFFPVLYINEKYTPVVKRVHLQ